MSFPFRESVFASEEAYIDFVGALRRAMAIFEICKTPSSHISPRPDGSIDIHCKTERCEILVNVPVGGGRVTFYGDNLQGKDVLKSGEESCDDGEAVHRIVNWIRRERKR